MGQRSDGPALAWERQSPRRTAAEYQAFRTGYLAAVAELRVTVEHWRPYGVKPVFLKALGQIADSIEGGWECDREDHTGEGCRARRPLSVASEAAVGANAASGE